MNKNSAMNEMLQINPNAGLLVEKWGTEIGAINEAFDGKLDWYRQATTAILLENTAAHIDRMNKMGAMNEATQPGDVGYFKKYAINLLSAAIPNLIAPDIVSMQPMLSRVGEMRFLKVLYGSNKGTIKAGDTMFSMFHGGNGETSYSSDEVDAEYVNFTPDAGGTGGTISGSLAWLPVVPGSAKLVVGTKEYTDNGAGKILDGANEVGTIDYNSGAFSITLATAPDESDDIYFNYRYNNMDVPVQAPEVTLKIEVAPIIAKSRKLKTIYAFDAAFDMSKDYGMQINNELVTYTASQIKHEIDGEIMGDLLRIASAAAVTWDATPREAISLRDHNESFYNKIVEAGNNIFDATKLANGSYIIVGMDAANVVETLPRFRPSGIIKPVGPHLAGYLGSMPVYKNPFYPADTFLVGWKGDGMFEAGYLYCPYMPIMSTQLIMDANFEGQRGFATSYGKKPVNSKMYCKGTITRS